LNIGLFFFTGNVIQKLDRKNRPEFRTYLF
jgi:hypothetical protein